jgi:DNA polymerase/3'-5' exonuclease PolX
MQLLEAQRLANRIVELLAPHCDTIDIAGSIRRERPLVKDVEVVAIPRKVFIEQPGKLFNETPTYGIPIAISNTIDQMATKIVKGNITGRYMQIELKGGAMLDLFLPEPKDYYRQLAIRTGSSVYAHKAIANAWLKLGWCGSDMGLRKTKDCLRTETSGKVKWQCLNPDGELPPMWLSEQEFFDWLKLPYLPPQQREFEPFTT